MVYEFQILFNYGCFTIWGLYVGGKLLFFSLILKKLYRLRCLKFQVLCYEAIKIFGDRLPQLEDKSKLTTLLNDVFKTNWEVGGITQQVLNSYFIPRLETSNKRFVFDKYSKENWQSEVERGISQFGNY